MTADLRLDKVSIALNGKVLIGPLDLTIRAGEGTTIMGPSGSGKSTLLAYVGGFVDRAFTARGRILLGDQDITHVSIEKRRVGMLFQDDLLLPHLSVGANLAFGLRPGRLGRAERCRLIDQVLAEAGLAGFAERDPATLSGGQRARAALLRTLLARPQALLLDEPFSKLDRDLRQEFRRFVFDHARQEGLPFILVTHDREDAEAAGGRIIEVASGAADQPL